ncbi:MAG TPA: hypothetical protein VI197_26695 [Polyangiaceae bacterium]
MTAIRFTQLRGGAFLAVLLVAALACSRPAVPDPKVAALEFARAAEAGDHAAVYALMTEQSRMEYGPAQTKELVQDASSELKRTGTALEKGPLTVQARAEIRYADGEQAVLELESGHFRVAELGTLPSGAVTPAQALSELRVALARRSYPALMRVMTSSTRGTMENNVRSLVNGLEEPETLDIDVEGDRAEVELPDGHTVRLKREEGVWKIEDFD